jgi:hypothetical protein
MPQSAGRAQAIKAAKLAKLAAVGGEFYRECADLAGVSLIEWLDSEPF